MNYIVKTPCGTVSGTKCKREGIIAYRGIRYGIAGRWELPLEVISWDGTIDGSLWGACAPQARAFSDESKMPKKQFYHREFRQGVDFEYSEDCLMLNIWTPERCVVSTALEQLKGQGAYKEKLPVIVYIHGGNFVSGSSNELPFQDPVWPMYDVIAVTINYRLGPLGFAAMPEFNDGDDIITNFGLYDQRVALSWIKHNISAFGGDPDNVILMGQSAGAMCVTHHMLSPLSQNLFSKVVMSSGGGLSPFTAPKPAEDMYEFWHEVMDELEAEDLDCLRKIPVQDLYNAYDVVCQRNKGLGNICFPLLDGKFITEDENVLIDRYRNMQMPMIIGCNTEDFVAPVFEKMAGDFAKKSKVPEFTYQYQFKRFLPGDDYGAFHSADLWYWFGTLDNSWRPFEDVDYNISNIMVKFLTNFAKFGDVNGDINSLYIDTKNNELPQWKPSRGKKLRMVFDDESLMGYCSMVTLVNNVIFHTSP